MWQFNDFLLEKISFIIRDLSLDPRLKVDIFDEQDFLKMRKLKPLTISVVVKHLLPTKLYGITNEPMQLVILSEDNSMEMTRIIFKRLSDMLNGSTEWDSSTAYKIALTQPQVLENYIVTGIGQKSILYATATLITIPNVADIKNLTLEGVTVDISNFKINYTMQGDSVAIGNNLVSTDKRSAVLVFSLSIPCVKNAITDKVFKIVLGVDGGNYGFTMTGTLADIDFTKTIKLNSCLFERDPFNIPSLVLGFQV